MWAPPEDPLLSRCHTPMDAESTDIDRVLGRQGTSVMRSLRLRGGRMDGSL
jgi:hypothetical protein